MIDAEHEAAERLCHRLQHIHHGLGGCRIVLVARPRVAGTGRDRVDDDEPERQPEFLLQRMVGLPSHRDQRLGCAFLQQQRGGLVPAKRSPLHVAALVANHRVKPQPHLAGAFGRDQQHAALPLHRMSQERLPGPERRREIEHDEGLAGAPLARQQAMPDRRHQPLDQPRLERPRVYVPVCIERRQLRVLLRLLLEFVEIVSSTSSSSGSGDGVSGWDQRLGLRGLHLPGWHLRRFDTFLGRLPAVTRTAATHDRRTCRRSWRSRGKPALAEISAGDAVRELLQMFADLLDAPAAAKVMADDHVKHVTAIGAGRSPFTHDPFNMVDVVARPTTVEALTVDLCCSRFCRRGFAASPR